MPNLYTHHRFGTLLLPKLSPKLQKICQEFSELYFLGQQGPDILFAHPKLLLQKNDPGHLLHRESGRNFLLRQKKWFQNAEKQKAAAAYLLGSMCHFILDSLVHEEVYKMENSFFDHYTIETELDRSYLLLDGEQATKFPLHEIIPSPKNCREILPAFYQDFPKVNEEVMEQCVRYFKNVKKFFLTPRYFKEKLLLAFMSLPKINKYKGFIMPSYVHPEAKQSFQILHQKFLLALQLAPQLLENALNFFEKNEELLPFFFRDYEGNLLDETGKAPKLLPTVNFPL